MSSDHEFLTANDTYRAVTLTATVFERVVQNLEDESLTPNGENDRFMIAQFKKELRLLCDRYAFHFDQIEHKLNEKPAVKNATAGSGFVRGVGATTLERKKV